MKQAKQKVCWQDVVRVHFPPVGSKHIGHSMIFFTMVNIKNALHPLFQLRFAFFYFFLTLFENKCRKRFKN